MATHSTTRGTGHRRSSTALQGQEATLAAAAWEISARRSGSPVVLFAALAPVAVTKPDGSALSPRRHPACFRGGIPDAPG